MTLPASGAISLFDVNDELGLTHTAAIGLLCTNVRTLFGTASGAVGLETGYGKSNTSVPGAPTIGSASSTGTTSASVSFSAPACTGHLTIDSYQAISSPGCITATGTSPISITGLSAATSYTFRVRAHNSKGYGCYSSSSGSVTTSAAPSSQSYTTSGTYSWVAPTGVTSVSVVAVGGGGTGGFSGGSLGYKNNYTVTPGSSYTVVVGKGGSYSCSLYEGTDSYFVSTAVVKGGGGGTSCNHVGDGGGVGGTSANGGGGGAGGYAGNGGNGGYNGIITAGSGGGGGGGRFACSGITGGSCVSAGGGGVGLLGQGSNGAAGTAWNGTTGGGGGGGSGGSNGGNATSSICGSGGSYGGAGGLGYRSPQPTGQSGAVRIIWPGSTRTFPSTCVGNP
jgi:hypothetical protein